MSTEDLGAPAYRKYDVEAWMPGLGRYGEVCQIIPKRCFSLNILGVLLKHDHDYKSLLTKDRRHEVSFGLTFMKLTHKVH